MESALPDCFAVLVSCKSREADAVTAALESVHRFVFFRDSDDGSDELLEPSKLLSSSAAVVEMAGSHLGPKTRADWVRLPLPAVVAELIARLTRVLLWEFVTSPQQSLRDRLKVLEADVKELEQSLLPRFFLNLPISPLALPNVLMRAPCKLFAQRYTLHENATNGDGHCGVPVQVADALTEFKVNFGCDFSFKARAGPAPGAAAVSEIPENRANSPHDAPKKCEPNRAAPLTGKGKLNVPQSSRPRQRLPGYMLTRRLAGTRRSRDAANDFIEHNTAGAVSPMTDGAAADLMSDDDEEKDVEVLAPATPERKRVRRNSIAIPPSPCRLSRSEAALQSLY